MADPIVVEFEIDSRQKAREVVFHTQTVPRLRLQGLAMCTLLAALNQFWFNSVSLTGTLPLALGLWAYGLGSWWLLKNWFAELQDRFNLGLLFLILDVPVWSTLIYGCGADRCWFSYLLLARVADQVATNTRRVLLFAHWVPFNYLLLVWVAATFGGHSVSWSLELSKALVMYVFGLYASTTARTAERLRGQTTQAVRSARQALRDLNSAREAAEAASTVKDEFLSKQASLMSQIQLAGIQVAGACTAISAAARHQQSSVGQQAAAATEIRAASHQIATTAGELSRTMGAVSQDAEGTAEITKLGSLALDQMQNRFREMVSASTLVVSKLATLSEKATGINSVVTAIARVAEQTNLLSLNAAIEAEKAGDFGRGFEVVAREIRRLADQTALATLDIENMVKGMQSAVSSGVMEMDKFREDVRQSEESVSEVVQVLTQITNRVGAMRDRYDQVNVGMKSQAQGARHISESIGQLTESAQEAATQVLEFSLVVQHLQEATKKLQGSLAYLQSPESVEESAMAPTP